MDVLDIEVPCDICKELVTLGTDYRCHLNIAHDISDSDDMERFIKLAQQRLNNAETEEITLDEEEDVKENTFAESCLFQCEICGDALKGKDAIEAHVDSLHMDIVEELEETVSDFYVLLPDPSLISSGDLLTSEEIAQIYQADKQQKLMTSKGSLKRKNSKKVAKIRP